MKLLFRIKSDNCLEAYILADNYNEAIAMYQRRYPDAVNANGEWLVNFIC